MKRSAAALPLVVWAGALTAAAVLSVGAVAALLLAAAGRLDPPAVTALAVGTYAGLGLCLVVVAGAARLAGDLRALHSGAVRRLQEPSAPLEPLEPLLGRPLLTRASAELGELARVLAALHLRVRLADELGERHRRDAETAGAGVAELLSGLVAAEEGARGQLAAELHDTVAQSLMIARSLVAGCPSTPAEFVRLGEYVEDAEEQVRAVMARTRPPALLDGDLASAVGALRLDVEARYGLCVQVRWPLSAYPLPLASAVTIYRFFQEALLNVVKHADVDDASLSLVIEQDQVLATVSD